MLQGSVLIRVPKIQEGEAIRIGVHPHRVLNRTVLQWSCYCGSHGQRWPGFFGLQLAAVEGKFLEEWLMLRIWDSDNWLNVNGRRLGANPSQYHEAELPLYSNLPHAKWDKFSELVIGKRITRFEIKKRSFRIDVGDAKIALTEDPTDRPAYGGTGAPRILPTDDDLRDAWMIAPWPWVHI